jgi:crossover junction endodeoxyribonuclease RusA
MPREEVRGVSQSWDESRKAFARASYRLTLPLPPSTNHLYKTVVLRKADGGRIIRRAKTKAAVEYERTVGLLVLGARLPDLAGYGLRLDVHLYFPDKRRHDVDNIKALIDALFTALGRDDSDLLELHVEKCLDRERPRAELRLSTTPPCLCEGESARLWNPQT